VWCDLWPGGVYVAVNSHTVESEQSDILNVQYVALFLCLILYIVLIIKIIKRVDCLFEPDSRASPAVWNNLPASIQASTDTESFCRLLITYFFNLAFTSITII